QLVSAHMQASIDPANAHSKTKEIHDTFDQQLSVLRNLQQAGARESTFFSARLSNYNAFLVSLTNLFHAGLYLSRHRVEPWFIDHMRQETESLLAAISDEFNILTTARPPGEKLRSSRLNEAFATFEEKVNEIRDHGVLIAAPLQPAFALAGNFPAIPS